MRPKFNLMAGAAVAVALAMTAGVAAAQTTAQSAQIKAAQQKLQAAGLYRGPADGLMDPDTGAALARFQERNGLRRSGQLDQQTYVRLLSVPAPATGYGSTGPVAATPARPPSASYHADNNSKNTPGGTSTWQPSYNAASASKNTPGGSSTWQPPVGTMTKNTPGG